MNTNSPVPVVIQTQNIPATATLRLSKEGDRFQSTGRGVSANIPTIPSWRVN